MSNARIQNNVVLFPIQNVSANTTSNSTTSSTSYSATALSTSFTPKYSTSRILVMVQGNSNGNAQYRIARDGSPLSAGYAPNNTRGNFVISYWDTAGSTSSRTYALQFRNYNGVGTAEFGWGANPPRAVITVTEFGA